MTQREIVVALLEEKSVSSMPYNFNMTQKMQDKMTSARDIAYTVAALSSERAKHIADTIVDVTGGMLI